MSSRGKMRSDGTGELRLQLPKELWKKIYIMAIVEETLPANIAIRLLTEALQLKKDARRR